MRNATATPAPLFTADRFSVFITRHPDLIREAQALRHRVFYQELAGRAVDSMAPISLDTDEFDLHCDHLLVHYLPEGADTPKIIGTYRLLRFTDMEKLGRFYTEGEFDISSMLQHKGKKIMELGRSCVDPDYRNGTVIQLLWRAIAAYIEQHDVETLFGCASFPGTDVSKHQQGLSYLHHFHRMPVHMHPTALPHVLATFGLIPAEKLNKRRAFVGLPPLIKGYLRLGALIGDGAVLDFDCNTTDVCIVLDRQFLTEKYVARLSPSSARESKSEQPALLDA